MKASVHNHLIPRGEGLATKLAAVGPRVGVDALVFAQQVATLKIFRTKRALKGSLVRVDAADVEQQLALPGVARPADVADVRLLPRVRAPVLVQVALLTETLLAKVARKWP